MLVCLYVYIACGYRYISVCVCVYWGACVCVCVRSRIYVCLGEQSRCAHFARTVGNEKSRIYEADIALCARANIRVFFLVVEKKRKKEESRKKEEPRF